MNHNVTIMLEKRENREWLPFFVSDYPYRITVWESGKEIEMPIFVKTLKDAFEAIEIQVIEYSNSGNNVTVTIRNGFFIAYGN